MLKIQRTLLMQHSRFTDVIVIQEERNARCCDPKVNFELFLMRNLGSEEVNMLAPKCMHTVPVSGTSVGLMILRICSIDCKSGDSPKIENKGGYF